jgi:hypothetical protein
VGGEEQEWRKNSEGAWWYSFGLSRRQKQNGKRKKNRVRSMNNGELLALGELRPLRCFWCWFWFWFCQAGGTLRICPVSFQYGNRRAQLINIQENDMMYAFTRPAREHAGAEQGKPSLLLLRAG